MKDILIILLICTFSIHLWMGETAQFPEDDAYGLLERSQGTRVFALNGRGNARNYVLGNIEDYSRGGNETKTAFESDEDQNDVMQRMINTSVAKKEIAELNKAIEEYREYRGNPFDIDRNLTRRQLYFRIRDLKYDYEPKKGHPKPNAKYAPYVRRFVNGTEVGARVRMVGAKLVIAHRFEEQLDINAEVLVYTMYPIAPRN